MVEPTDDQDTPTKTSGQPHQEAIRKPPQSKREVLKYLGPSLAVAAITVGSGELIATTALGARVGIVVLWFLIISLIMKVGIQYHLAKYGLIANKTPHEIFDEIPGKIFGHSWAWWWMVVFWVFATNFHFAGIFFGASTMLYYLLGQTIPLWIASLIVLVIAIYPALRGYDFVEDFAIIMVGILTIITIIAAGLSFTTQACVYPDATSGTA